MNLLFGIASASIGIVMALIGFKIYIPFKEKNDPEREGLWYNKFGTFFKIAGIVLLTFGLLGVVENV